MAREPKTIPALFHRAVESYREDAFLRFKKAGVWHTLRYGEVARRVRELALGLHRLGVKRGDRVAIWSENRPEWNLADLAILVLGAVDVPIYATQAAGQIEFILADAGTSVIFVSAAFREAARELRDRVGCLEQIICFDGEKTDASDREVLAVETIVEEGRKLYGEQPGLYDGLWQAIEPERLATLIYTSGTTGEPKGVMLSHRNLTANVLNIYEWLELAGRRDEALTYLPFSHIFERAAWYLYMHAGTVFAYAESIDRVAANLSEVRPTVMKIVPRMFEKIYARILERGLGSGFPRRQLFLWALGVGREWAEARDKGQRVGLGLRLQYGVANRLVFRSVRAALGGRIRLFISGGAALAPEVAYFFAGAGLVILQGYGLTETSPSISCNQEGRNRIGSVGPVIGGVEVRLAEDGEIEVRGESVMQGYYNREAENREASTADGWFRTGDIGYLDANGFLYITDRKKELIKTSGGKYIAPQKIESLIKASRFVSQVVVIGEARKYAVALIVPNWDLVRSYAAHKGLGISCVEELRTHPRIGELIQRQVDKHTEGLSGYERVKRVALLTEELSVESGELTPTLKPRRAFIESRYGEVIEGLYLSKEQLSLV